MKTSMFIAAFSLIFVGSIRAVDDPAALIEELRVSRLTKELTLTAEQAAVFFPKLNELIRIEREFNAEKTALLNELKNLVKQESDDVRINEVLQRYEQANRRKFDAQIDKTEEMWTLLTVTQRARFLIFQDEFNREIREMIKRIKTQKSSD